MKMYMPNNLINNNFIYEIYDNYYQVKTNQNCYTNYNTTYCNCYRVYYKNNYAVTSPFSCSVSSSSYTIQNTIWTDDWFYRVDMPQIILVTFIFIFIIWYVVKLIMKGVRIDA